MKNGQLRKSTAIAFAVGVLSLGAAASAHATSVSVGGGALKITGDSAANIIELKLSSSDSSKLDVDIDGDLVADQTIPLVDFKTISADLGDGADSFKVNEANGAFTNQKQTTIVAGPGDDLIVGGAGGELIAGNEGEDTVRGLGGDDVIDGGDDFDIFSWKVGEGHDTINGGAGDNDLLVANGTAGPDSFVIGKADATHVAIIQEDKEALFLTGVDRLNLATIGGDDHIEATPNVGDLLSLTLNAGAKVANDDDTVKGSDGADTIFGFNGADTLDGRGGDDTIKGGAGEDAVIGGSGHDVLKGELDRDSFDCDQLGEALDFELGEAFTAPCFPAPAPTDAAGGAGGDTVPAQTVPATDPLGFAKPSVRATKTGLRVTLRSTSGAPVSVSVRAAERFKSRRAARYRIVKTTIATGGRVTLTLRAPRALRKRIARQLALRHRVIRRPAVAVTNTATAARTSVHPRLTLRVR